MSGPKKRKDIFHKTENWYQWRGNASSTPNAGNIQDTVATSATGTQDLQISLGHPYRKLGKSTGDIGGNFCVVRREYSDNSRVYKNRTVANPDNTLASNYQGKYCAKELVVTDIDYPAPVIATDNELDVMGATAISLSLPTNPISGVLVALGELRSEGIPSIVGAQTWKSRTASARNAGSEYLNYQFGWLPLVSDVQDVAHAVHKSDEIIAKYEAESGKLLHRTFTFPTSLTSTTSVETGVYPEPAFVGGYWSSAGTRTTVTTTRVENWFSGAFTYYLPPKGSVARDVAIADKLFAARPTPETFWNLTPWTWAADWFTNVGDIVHNISAFQKDGLVMPYGYMMRRRTIEKTITITGAKTNLWNPRPVDCFQRFTTIVKQRRKATPYGFGLLQSSLTTKQWSILAALGLSRGSSGMKFQ
jgi:hypothetical protein